jgi:hypothetical protein
MKTNYKTELLNYLSYDNNLYHLETLFGAAEQDIYFWWIMNNIDNIDMTDYMNEYNDYSIAGMIEDMYGMHLTNTLNWEDYMTINEKLTMG